MFLTFYLFLMAPILFAASTPRQIERTPLSSVALKQWPSQQNLRSRLPPAAYSQNPKKLDQVKQVPWICFAKNETGQVCSCTIISKNFVLAKSTCIQNALGSIQVHAGATNENNAEQVVAAAVLETSDPAPAGIVGIKLATELKFSSRVSNIKMINRMHDNHFGFVSGFGHKNGTYELGVFEAAIFEFNCNVGLCVVGNRWPQFSNNPSKATDFLDYYDDVREDVYFIGVLYRHIGANFAVYHKVKEMTAWIIKHLEGCAVESTLRR